MDAPTTIELTASIGEVLVALGALAFALLLARHEAASRDRIERKLDDLSQAVKRKGDEG